MTERSRPWTGTVTGDAGPYTFDQWAAVWRTIIQTNTNNEGVFRDQLNELAVSGVASPVTVATGRALVHGTWYESDASVNVAVPTPAGATRIDRIVLQKVWATQTIRVARVAGVEGGGAPALTQNDGVQWEIPLAQVSITVGGVITVTDQREFAPGGILRRIASTTLAAPAATIDFQNIPQTYQHLFVVVSARSDSGSDRTVQARFNNDSGSNYDDQNLRGTAGTPASGEAIGAAQINLGASGSNLANVYAIFTFWIPRYASASVEKALIGINVRKTANASGAITVRAVGGFWRNTAAITRLTFLLSSDNYDTGCQVSLYGIT